MSREEVRETIRVATEDILITSYPPKVEHTTTVVAMTISAQSEMRFERQDIAEKVERHPPLLQTNWTRSIRNGD